MASYNPLSGSLTTVVIRERYLSMSTVFGGSVHNDVFYVVVSLRDNTLDGIFQYFLGIVGHRDNRELGSRMDTMHISLLFCCKRPCTSSL